MGIDWEEILGAEGEDMADAYVDAMPDDGPTTAEMDAYIEAAEAEDEARYRAEGLKQLYDDERTPKDYDGLLNEYYDTLEEMDALEEQHAWEIVAEHQVICQELKDLKKLFAVLRMHHINIPEDIEKRYRNHSIYELMNSINFKVEEEVKNLAWEIQKEGKEDKEDKEDELLSRHGFSDEDMYRDVLEEEIKRLEKEIKKQTEEAEKVEVPVLEFGDEEPSDEDWVPFV